MQTIMIAGTGAWTPGDNHVDWFEPGSPFATFLRSHHINVVFGPNDAYPFTWSTALGGVGFGEGDLKVWHAAGINLYGYIVPPLCPHARIPPRDTALIAHSHGLQVALYALACGLKADVLISVGSPLRKDMEPVMTHARANVRYWLHIHSDRSDRWQWLGTLFDGRLGIIRPAVLADRNDCIKNVGHSELLRNPQYFSLWLERGWLDLLKG